MSDPNPRCPVCGKSVRVSKDGTIGVHPVGKSPACKGSYQKFAQEALEP